MFCGTVCATLGGIARGWAGRSCGCRRQATPVTRANRPWPVCVQLGQCVCATTQGGLLHSSKLGKRELPEGEPLKVSVKCSQVRLSEGGGGEGGCGGGGRHQQHHRVHAGGPGRAGGGAERVGPRVGAGE